MTLNQWVEKNQIVAVRCGHARIVRQENNSNRSQLWKLSDYKVSGVNSGLIWLVRNPTEYGSQFSDSQRSQRQNIRNACCSCNIHQMQQMMESLENRNDSFGRDCVEEFMMEWEAEQNQ